MKVRLFLTENILDLNQKYFLNHNQSHYLINVLRLKNQTEIFVFNNKDGEFKAQMFLENKKIVILIIEKTSGFYKTPNINLVFAPVKNVKTEYLITKATELGVQKIYPIVTKRTIINKINLDKLKINSIEAAEQSRRVDLPQIYPVAKLKAFLANLQSNDIVILADESGAGLDASKLFANLSYNPNYNYYLIIGPEGGFDSEERVMIKELENSYSLILGPRILRSDTAIIAALTLLQNYLGDMKLTPDF
jgi:16S rRNA (uracil1498-N3)-methyltransferase